MSSRFVFFPRRVAGQPLLAITLDLSLRASVPDPSRPWLTRVDTRLRKPSRDGVADDPAEIETVGELGASLCDRVAVAGDGHWVGMHTRQGVRTWLFYTAAVDPVATAVAAAFAGQDQYAATVSTIADAGWGEYLALCPTEAEQRTIRLGQLVQADKERAGAMTVALVKSLLARGDDVVRERPIDYTVLLPTTAARTAFVDLAVASGFRLPPKNDRDPASPATQAPIPVTVTRDGPAHPDALSVVEGWIIVQARHLGGTYDGWGCLVPASRPPPA